MEYSHITHLFCYKNINGMIELPFDRSNFFFLILGKHYLQLFCKMPLKYTQEKKITNTYISSMGRLESFASSTMFLLSLLLWPNNMSHAVVESISRTKKTLTS